MQELDVHTSFSHGFVLGLLVGEGHFGGDGRQPQLTLKLHARHEPLLRYVMSVCAGGRLYGPYHHSDRHYFQLMYRGAALRDNLLPLLDTLPWAQIDPHSYQRYSDMKSRYARFLGTGIRPSTAAAFPEFRRAEESELEWDRT